MSRLAVVLFNLGGPDGPDSVRPFLFNLFRDPAIISAPALVRYPLAALISSRREKSAQANYARMGGGSPQLPWTRRQAAALEAELSAARPDLETRVFIAMRYWAPLTEATAREVEAFAPDEIVLLPLYPQFSTTTTASSLKAWRAAYKGPERSRAVCCYPTAAGWVAAQVRAIESTWDQGGRPDNLRLLFSAHGLPEKVIAGGDPYQAQIEAGAGAIAARLSKTWEWTICYQSRVGPLKWLGPSTDQEIRRAGAQGKGVLVAPIAFVSEHIETLVELDHDYAELARSSGCAPYLRAPALGLDADFIAALRDATLKAADRAPGTGPVGDWTCPGLHGQCPRTLTEGQAA